MANNYWIQIKALNASQSGWFQNTPTSTQYITIKPNQLNNIYFINTTPRDIWCQVGNRSNNTITLRTDYPIAHFADGTVAYDTGGDVGKITIYSGDDHWLGHQWLGVNTGHHWYLENQAATIKWTFGLGYLVPTNETKITAAHAKALGEMVGCKRNALSVTAGNSIGPSSNAYSGQSGVSSNNKIKNTTQTAIYNSLTNGTTRCGK